MYAYTNTYIHAMTIGEKRGHIFEIGRQNGLERGKKRKILCN